MNVEHIPVLADKLAELITFSEDATIVDCTTGFGGHSSIFASRLGAEGTLMGFDVDPKCLANAQQVLSDLKCKVLLKNNNFSQISSTLYQEGIGEVDFILADLGWCSGQIVDSDKGLSFQENQPLDMRLDSFVKKTAEELVNNLGEEDLANLIFKYGQDRASRRIARFIVEFRENQPIKTTGQLSFIVCKALGKSPGGKGIHPATRTFQALRIAVNGELEVLESLLEQSPEILKPGGKIAIISFHSLEDKIVKENFKDNAKAGVYELLTKKPIVPDYKEVRHNPRARSAKLRIAQRV